MTRVIVAAALAAASAVALVAQGRGVPALPSPPEAAAQTEFRSSVEIVHLDVSVLDRLRQPVRGLTIRDFTVFVDGRAQDVSVFNAVEVPPADPPVAPWMRTIAPDVLSNAAVQERRLFLILVDDASVEGDGQAIRSVKTAGRRVVESLGPADLAAVIYTMDNRKSQDFTTDRGRLLAAIDRYTVGPRGMAPTNIACADCLVWQYSTTVIEKAVETFSALPGRRKTLILIGQGVPLDLGIVSAPQAPSVAGPDGAPAGASALSMQGVHAQLLATMQRAFAKAARANVNIYPIDVCGPRIPTEGRMTTNLGDLGMIPPTCAPGLEQDFLRTVAANTGGRAIVDTSDFSAGVKAIFDENSAYYLLGFRPTDTRQDGKVRRLEVKVSRPDVVVRTRSGYEGLSADTARRAASAAAQPLGVALSGILPKSDLPLRLTAVPLAVVGREQAAVVVIVNIQQPIRQNAERVVEHVDLQVGAYDSDGKAFGTARFNADVAIRAGASGLADYEVASRLDLKPGRYQLRVGAHVGSIATAGSLYYDLDVPDYGKAPLSLSPLMVAAATAPIAGTQDAVKTLLPFVPTSRRAFNSSDQAAAVTRVYQGGREPLQSVPIDLVVRDETDRAVFRSQHVIAADQFAPARSADLRVDLPLARLSAGEHLLTLEAQLAGKWVRRDLRFVVRPQ